jgi:pimeloyl-ACP methyl ester carboxylesterase
LKVRKFEGSKVAVVEAEATGNGQQGESAVAETARGPVEYGEFGAGVPVLMVHGTPGGSDQGLALARILALREHRVVSPSRPGYLGTRLGVGSEPEAQADALAALLDALGIERAAVIANSAGGAFAIPFALRHPGRISRLILLQSVTAQMQISVDDLLHAALLLPRSTSVAPSVVGLALRRFEPSLIKQSLALAWSTLPVAGRRAGVLNDALQIGRLPAYPLGEIQAPTLLIHGTADQNVPFAQSVVASEAIPGARLLSFPGGNHSSVLFERGTIAAVREFLRQQGNNE